MATDIVEVSYTGDLLAHRRCARAWAYEKHTGFHPYEQVQAMEGRLIHHAMEWLTRRYHEDGAKGKHATAQELEEQLMRYFSVLWARGIRTRFASKRETLERVVGNLYPKGRIDKTVKAAVEGAKHAEYEIRAIRKVLPGEYAGKSKILLTGILDLVVQQQQPIVYEHVWTWDDEQTLAGRAENRRVTAHPGDEEIWDYKGTKASTPYLMDYVRQLLTYAALYRDRVGYLPARCVLFFINERVTSKARLLAIEVTEYVVESALAWTHKQVRELQQTVEQFIQDPLEVEAGERERAASPRGKRVTPELKKQCTTCGLRFDCAEYRAFLGKQRTSGTDHPDVDRLNVYKN